MTDKILLRSEHSENVYQGEVEYLRFFVISIFLSERHERQQTALW